MANIWPLLRTSTQLCTVPGVTQNTSIMRRQPDDKQRNKNWDISWQGVFFTMPRPWTFQTSQHPNKVTWKTIKNLHNHLIIRDKIGVKHLNFVIQNISVIHWWLDYGERKPIIAPRETHSNPSQRLVNLPTCGQNRSQHQLDWNSHWLH